MREQQLTTSTETINGMQGSANHSHVTIPVLRLSWGFLHHLLSSFNGAETNKCGENVFAWLSLRQHLERLDCVTVTRRLTQMSIASYIHILEKIIQRLLSNCHFFMVLLRNELLYRPTIAHTPTSKGNQLASQVQLKKE